MSGRSEIALNAKGRGEAERLAERLAGVPLSAVHASPRRRAVETARFVAAARGLPVREITALDEIDFGEWSGRTFTALSEDPAWRHWNAARATAATPAGETMEQAAARAVTHVRAIGEDGAVLCVSHCDVIRGIVARCLGLGMDRLFAFECDPGSLTTIETDGDTMRLVTLNERPR